MRQRSNTERRESDEHKGKKDDQKNSSGQCKGMKYNVAEANENFNNIYDNERTSETEYENYIVNSSASKYLSNT